MEFDKVLITGDFHRDFTRLNELDNRDNCAIICLGDFGINYFLDERDDQEKKSLMKKYPFWFYVVRGNHEARPQNVTGMKLVYDEFVHGEVYVQDEYPRIRYFKDWGEYNIEGISILAVGGAYSVDKYYRLTWGHSWFVDEQLTEVERDECLEWATHKNFDVVLTHTCPYDWRPVDKFLPSVDQNTVDNTMEKFLRKLRERIGWSVWAWGHYHDDRIEQPFAEMYYREFENLFDMVVRWQDYQAGADIEGTRAISPLYVGER